MAERDTFVGEEAEQYTEEQLRQMQEDAKVRAQHAYGNASPVSADLSTAGLDAAGVTAGVSGVGLSGVITGGSIGFSGGSTGGVIIGV